MDAAKPAGKKAQAPPTGADDAQPAEPDDAVAVAGCDDDEQVERFYALLDNIRTMRGMLGGTGTAAAEARSRKRRAREAADPPWRPAFRMEDFEVVEEADSDSAAACSAAGHQRKEKGKVVDDRRGSSAGCGATQATAGDEEEDDGEAVVEEAQGGPPRKPARRVARECAG